MMSIFSERLKELRKEKGLTQKELANKVNMGQGGYTHWETGKREPNFDKIKLLARYLDTSVDYLLGEVDDKRSSQAILNSLGETNNRLDEILNRIPNNNFICSNLRRLREEKGLTIEDVEKALSSRGKYLDWELGVSEPSIESTVDIANYFQVNVSSLFSGNIYKSNNYESVNTFKDAFISKLENKIYKFKDDILDLVYDFGYKYTDIKVSEKDFISALNYSLLVIKVMNENLEYQLAPVKDDMLETYQREEAALEQNIEKIKKSISEEKESDFSIEQLELHEKILEIRKERAKNLVELNSLEK